MTQEDKFLLLRDLSARLPYGVKVAVELYKGEYTRVYDLREIDNDTTSELRQRVTIWNYGVYSSVISYPLIECRPYLRPMSSMTEEEKLMYEGLMIGTNNVSYMLDVIDWLNAHHFDYRGLIEKGLALEAKEGMYE